MSKSEGNVVDCYWEGIEVDCVRLYFITEGPQEADAEFEYSAMIAKYN